MAEKPHLNLATIGHVDHGKSTLVGRLLMETGAIPAHIIDEYRKKAKEIGKDTFEFAWTMDTLKEERERGLTIDVSHIRFDTPKYYFTMIDCPGHRDFVKNMITGASQADAAILVVSSKPGEGVQDQTTEHMFLAWTLGIRELVVLINKMDAANYDQKRFEEVKTEVLGYLQKAGFRVPEIKIIPGSAFKGDNIAKKSENMKWYTGPTLLEALDGLKGPDKDKPAKLSLRIPVQDVYTISGVGTVPVGKVETGKVKKGDKVIFNPGNKATEIKSIEMHHEEIPEALPGDNIGFNIRGLSREDIRRGDVCGPESNPPTVVEEFTARIIVLKHPSAISAGYTPVFHIHTAQVACTVTEIKKKIDPKTGATVAEKPDFIKAGDAAVIQVRPSRPIVVEKFEDFPPLGRFAIRDMGMTVAAGMIIDVKPKTA